MEEADFEPSVPLGIQGTLPAHAELFDPMISPHAIMGRLVKDDREGAIQNQCPKRKIAKGGCQVLVNARVFMSTPATGETRGSYDDGNGGLLLGASYCDLSARIDCRRHRRCLSQDCDAPARPTRL